MWQRFWQAILVVGLSAPGAIAGEYNSQLSFIAELDLSDDAGVEASVVFPTIVSGPIQSVILLGESPADVMPDHWAAPAVTNLIDNYGCLAGYPDGTFRGDDLVTRYEFAAAMDACLTVLLNQIEQTRQTEPVDLTELMNSLDALEAELGSLSENLEDAETENAETVEVVE